MNCQGGQSGWVKILGELRNNYTALLMQTGAGLA